ncbi:unnamed protein product [Hyaloperonospora brassicae]|uniref:Uncharacterized protein n=1 Tax=Hyaloperonospora brassicae TaxID=162125 RepID=A0AAV0TP58_HYABA|nr:unnamed protein product [Hyaloperonospora brassicae]
MPVALVAETRDVAAAVAHAHVPSVVTLDNGQCSVRSFLQARPSGVYTCARAKTRTVGLGPLDHLSKVIVDWPFHVHRLKTSLELKLHNAKYDTSKLSRFQMATERLVTAVLKQWQATTTTETMDGMLSVLWYPLPESTNSGYGLAVHLCSMPQVQSTTSTLLVYGEGRENARCKHSKWIDDRVPLERHRAHVAEKRLGPIDEILLRRAGRDGDQLLLEGLVTNFFVVCEDRVYTADEGVLEGSVRKLVLDACRELSILVVLEPPKLSERTLWQAAFITSVVRVVMSVTRLVWEEEINGHEVMQEWSIPSDTCDLVQRIRDHVSMHCMCLE